MEHPELIRAFVALEVPPRVLGALREAQEELKRRAMARGIEQEVRWVDPKGIHLTLKFLGGVPATQLPAIEAALRAGLAGQTPFSLTLGEAGVFPRLAAPRVLWIGVGGALPILQAVQQRVEAALVPLGYPAEARPFAPHLTLGRVRETVGAERRRTLGGIITAPLGIPAPQWEVHEVSLMRSELRPGGARYSRLATFILGRR